MNIEIARLMCEFDTCFDRKDSISGSDVKKEAIKAVAKFTQTNTPKFSVQTSFLKPQRRETRPN